MSMSMSMSMEWLNCAFDWSHRRDVPMKAWRDDYGDWFVTLEFKDSEGWFNHSIVASERIYVSGEDGKKRKETDAEMSARVEKALIAGSAVARKRRVQKLSGADPVAMRVRAHKPLDIQFMGVGER